MSACRTAHRAAPAAPGGASDPAPALPPASQVESPLPKSERHNPLHHQSEALSSPWRKTPQSALVRPRLLSTRVHWAVALRPTVWAECAPTKHATPPASLPDHPPASPCPELPGSDSSSSD